MKPFFLPVFSVSFVSYFFFFFTEYVRPGFVMPVFSVHIIGFLALVFGVITLVAEDEDSHRALLIRFTLSFLLFLLFMQEGLLFGGLAFVLALSAAALPWLIPFSSQRE